MAGLRIIQGGMGVAVSGWRLANAVSRLGQLGVVSGTGLAVVLTRRLQQGDPDGAVRGALERFPFPAMARAILNRYYVPGGKPSGEPFLLPPMPAIRASRQLDELTVAANFVEVFLAKQGHDGPVGINYLEKIQFATLPSLFGAMLAGVDYVIMGAGIPRWIPGALDRLSEGAAAELRVDVVGAAEAEPAFSRFDPADFSQNQPLPALRRPAFVAIVASNILAATLVRKSNGRVDGLIIEGPSAGGHNAPPRGQGPLSDRGEPVYGERDEVDLEKIRQLNVPFWLAGGFASAGRLAEALAAGAQGIQVGTAFAFCDESGITPELKREVIRRSRAGELGVFTDPLASPTGFPFKVLQLDGTLASAEVYEQRPRLCDLGYLRRAYARPDGAIGYRCPAERVEDYVAKGGTVEETAGRKCICNGLFGTVGLGQEIAPGFVEPCIVTAGDDVSNVHQYAPPGADSYSAADVISRILAPAPLT